MKEIFYELIEEASKCNVTIDGEEWPIGFNTVIYQNNQKQLFYQENTMPLLRIANEETFLNLLSEYVSLELEKKRKAIPFLDQTNHSHIKYIMAYLFSNATTTDFENPEQFIKRRIAFLQDDTLTYLNDGLIYDIGENFLGSKMEIKNSENSLSMETPYKIDITLVTDNNLRCPILSIYYGITEDKTCYIYSLMKPKESKNASFSEEENFKKRINRLLYKLNEGVLTSETEEFLEYKNGTSAYYPENISDVTSSFILGLTSFMALLESAGINKIKGVPYLPVRYLSRDFAAQQVKEEEKRQALEERKNKIQYNATNKFIRTFRRVMYHLSDLKVYSYPYELDECINLTLNEENIPLKNELLDAVFYGVKNQVKTKKI